MTNMIQLGHTPQNRLVALPTDKLTHHAAVMGMTGSGKTGMLFSMAEQLIEQNIPIILVDIKGDMCNIGVQNDPKFREKFDLRVLTPGGSHGEKINLFANIQKPERVRTAVTQILKMTGEKKVDPLSSRQHAFLSKLLNHYHAQNEHADLSLLIEGLLDPPFNTFGALPLESAVPSRTREALAAKLNNLLVAPSFELWRQGKDIDLDRYLAPTDGRTPVVVYSVAHLTLDDERTFALGLLFDSLVAWMRQRRGTDKLRACLFVDECVGILPPHPANPVTKVPLLTMLKQARAYGLGVILASQNPMDLDYKALSNCQTWIVGRLQMANDRRRVIEAITAVTPHDRNKLEARVGRLVPRDFVLCRPRSTADFTSRDVQSTSLIGPMTPQEVEVMMNPPVLTDEDFAKLLGEEEAQ